MRILILLLPGLIGIIFPRAALACSVCFGGSDANELVALKVGIFTMLGVLLCIFAGVISFFINMRKRTKNLAAGNSIH